MAAKLLSLADIEHYYGGVVMPIAKAIAGKDVQDLPYRSRKAILDKAAAAVQALLRD